MSSARRSSGQVLLIVLLGVTGALFMVLSIASRSVNDLSQTSLSQSSSQAFSAAEAGIENALLGGVGIGVTVGNSTYTNSNVPLSAATKAFNYPVPLSSGEMAYLWLVNRDGSGNFVIDGESFRSTTLDLCWGNVGVTDPNIPAIEFEIYYDTTTDYVDGIPPTFVNVGVKRTAYDPVSTRSNNFVKTGIVTDCVIDKVAYAYGTEININTLGIANPCPENQGCLMLATAKILYSSQKQPVGFRSDNTANEAEFPSQGVAIESIGTADGSTRKVQLVQTFENPESIFTNGIYAGGNVN